MYNNITDPYTNLNEQTNKHNYYYLFILKKLLIINDSGND